MPVFPSCAKHRGSDAPAVTFFYAHYRIGIQSGSRNQSSAHSPMKSCATQSTATARWPFWLLLVAWVCVHSPQTVMPTVLTWLAEARSFSHQRDLSRSAAFVLAGEKASSRVAIALARVPASQQDTPPQLPISVPPTAVLKKIDLATEWLIDVRPPAEQGALAWKVELGCSSRQRARPPHGPPRTGNMI